MCQLKINKKLWRNFQINSGRIRLRGFTLIEVLLALMIFSTLSMAASQVFRNVITSSEQSEQVGNELKNLQRALLILDSDFRQIMARQYRNGGDEPNELLIEIGDGLLESDSQGIRFVRGGWINPQGLYPRGDVVKVGYRIKDNVLERLRWMYPDDSKALDPAVMPMMADVEEIKFEVMAGNNNSWEKNWNTALVMPKAIRILFKTKRYGELERIYLLPAQTLSSSAANNTTNQS